MEANDSFENQVVDTYRKRAARYDVSAKLYYLIGYWYTAYRKRAVQALGLQSGDAVVEVGCGTGQNFPLLQKAVGPTGKIIGVDLTDAMLDQARQRVGAAGWSNVELVQSDAAEYEFPDQVDGILSTFALSLSPRCDEVIRNGSEALSPGRRWAVLDMKMPSNSLSSKILPLVMPFLRPFAITEEVIERRPWKAIEEAMSRNLEDTSVTELYLGTTYLASGKRTAVSQPPIVH